MACRNPHHGLQGPVWGCLCQSAQPHFKPLSPSITKLQPQVLSLSPCRASTPVLPSVWKYLFPLLQLNPPHPVGLSLNVISSERFRQAFPISMRCNIFGLNQSPRFSFMALHIIYKYIFTYVSVFLISALHLSRNATTGGIFLSTVPGTAAASSTVPGMDRCPLKNSRG